MNEKKARMTPAQMLMMARLVADGVQVPPGGMGRRSAVAASAWWRTVDAMVRAGWVKAKSVQGGGTARATEAGRDYYRRVQAKRLSQ